MLRENNDHASDPPAAPTSTRTTDSAILNLRLVDLRGVSAIGITGTTGVAAVTDVAGFASAAGAGGVASTTGPVGGKEAGHVASVIGSASDSFEIVGIVSVPTGGSMVSAFFNSCSWAHTVAKRSVGKKSRRGRIPRFRDSIASAYSLLGLPASGRITLYLVIRGLKYFCLEPIHGWLGEC